MQNTKAQKKLVQALLPAPMVKLMNHVETIPSQISKLIPPHFFSLRDVIRYTRLGLLILPSVHHNKSFLW